MEQLYRSLYEIRELSIENMIRRILFQDQIVSLKLLPRKNCEIYCCGAAEVSEHR